MGIKADIEQDFAASLAALAWQLDLGADEAICEAPQSAYDLPEKAPWQARATPPSPAAKPKAPAATPPAPVDPSANLIAACEAARRSAANAADLASLDTAAAQFEMCPLRNGARGAARGLGHERAAVLVICNPPSSDAERAGTVLSPAENALLETVFKCIELSLTSPNPSAALHLAPAMPWPLRGMGDDRTAALAMMRPFVLRRIALIQPKVVVVMGHDAVEMLLNSASIARARGQWHRLDVPESEAVAMAMHDPASMAKSADVKRAVWEDALAIKAKLRG